MSLWQAFRAAFSPGPTLRAVHKRLDELEEAQTRREMEWRETRDQLKRHLARLAELDRRAELRDGSASAEAPNGKPSARELLALKYPRGA